MAWRDARTRIKALLETVAIITPIEQTIARVYATPPATIQDTPSFVIYPPALVVERASSLRIKHYTVRLRLFVLDADISQAADLVDAYREAVIDVFDTDVRLNGTCTLIVGPAVEEAASVEYGSTRYTVIDCLLTVEIQDPTNFT
jgi:hypothetical protein